MTVDALEFKAFKNAFESDLQHRLLKYGKNKNISAE